MKPRIFAFVAACLCCLSCVSVNDRLGGSLIPIEQTYSIFSNDSLYLKEIYVKMADSLSGFSQNRITVGAIRDKEYGLTTRSAAFALVPMVEDYESTDPLFGSDPVFKSFHFAAAADSGSVAASEQASILQNIYVYPLEKAIDATKDYDTNSSVPHSNDIITEGIPVYGCGDSLSFNFTKEFGEKYLSITRSDLKDMKTFTSKFPGIFIETEKPKNLGGRIDIFQLQLSYDSQFNSIGGNYAELKYSAKFNGERKDTSMYFYYGPTKLFKLDSLFQSSATGEFPQYSLNMTGHETRKATGPAKDKILIEGGGGLKPMIPAKYLKKLAEDEIIKSGGRPDKVVINKATLVFPFEFPADYKEVDDLWPDILSPTCKIRIDDKRVTFMGLTDSSSSTENQGDINRSRFIFAPDITYHLQELLKIDESKPDSEKMKKLNRGEYDIWLLIMHNEIITTTTEGDSDMSEYYNYLAYQSYYNSMYGGYGGYGGYGYGGYNDYYTNYYSYMMMAQYAGQSQTSQSISVQLDKDRYYKAVLNGPEYPTVGLRPRLEITYSLPDTVF